MFFISFKIGDNYPTRRSIDKCYMPLVEMKDFNKLINKKSFFDQPVKKKLETYRKPVQMSRDIGYIA